MVPFSRAKPPLHKVLYRESLRASHAGSLSIQACRVSGEQFQDGLLFGSTDVEVVDGFQWMVGIALRISGWMSGAEG